MGKYKLFILLFVGIILIGNINAFVTISENPLEIEQRVETTENYSITLTNNFPFQTFDFKFGNLESYGISFPEISLEPNETKTINFQVTPIDSVNEEIDNKVEFNYFVNIPEEISTYEVLIKEQGFDPTFLAIREGDSIKFINQDNIVHRVLTQFFNEQISPNQSYTYTFNERGKFQFQDPFWDEYFQFNGEIEVVNRTSQEKVHNPLYDFTWTTNLRFILNPTTLDVSLQGDIFDIEATAKTEGSIRLENTGNETAEKITLSSTSPWITFKENNFDVAVNTQNFVEYEISPLIFSTDETNKTYTINLTIEGLNVEKISKTIKVFIPFNEEFNNPQSPESIFALLEKFCKANPTHLFCDTNQTIIIQGDGENKSFTINVTEEDWREFKQSQSRSTTGLIRLENGLIKLENDFLLIEIIADQTNQTLIQQEENKKKQRRTNATWTIIIFFLIVFYVITKRISKESELQKKQSIVKGRTKTRYSS